MIGRHAKAILGVDVPVMGVPLYTDARHYAAAGIPIVLYGAGPRSILEANAHNADENLRLNDLRAATKIVALTAADLLGAGWAPERRILPKTRAALYGFCGCIRSVAWKYFLA